MTQPSFLPKLPHDPGVYFMRDFQGSIIYIGKARNLKKRVASYFVHKVAKEGESSKTAALVSNIRQIDYVVTVSEREALVLERKLISQYKPVFNVMWKDDKSYPYIKLTLAEDFPRLLLTREKKRDGNAYFGPYPNVSQIRNLMRWAWRKKIFPLRPCRYEFSEKNLLDYKKVRHCLYLHTGECSAPCIGKISKENYADIVRQALWFFRGQKESMLKSWLDEMKSLSVQLKYEQAAEIRDRIQTIDHMNQHVLINQITEKQLELRIQEGRGVQQLMQVLHLPRLPERIECFDISHFQGQEKVASMVSFFQGKPDKQNYRKFIINTVAGIDDFKSMFEVVGRRYRRLKKESKAFPDLVLIDGGKGQLSSALESLKEADIRTIFVASLAKEQEEIFVPGQSQSIRLPMDSPALLLLRFIRDEAHRFAITFNRSRRAKSFLKG